MAIQLFTKSGIPYMQHFVLAGGQPAYSERFARDANAFTAYLSCNWADANDFRRDMLGYSEFDPTTPLYFARTMPEILPYTSGSYAYEMTLVNYGRVPTDGDVATFDAEVAAAILSNGLTAANVSPAFFSDIDFDGYFSTHRCIYKVDYARMLYPVVDNSTFLTGTGGAFRGVELSRFAIIRWSNNVRELRVPDYNFLAVGGGPSIIKVNGFIPSVESEMTFTWYQVPYRYVPFTAINKNRLKINDAVVFDRTIFPLDGSAQYDDAGFETETMLFVDAKGIDIPYQGPDGGYYCDIQYLFRRKHNYLADGTTVVGHQHFLDASGNWVKVERKNNPGRFLYYTTANFVDLFTPEVP